MGPFQMSSKLFVACVALLAFQFKKFPLADIDGAVINSEDLTFFLNLLTTPHTSSDPNDAASTLDYHNCFSGKKSVFIGKTFKCVSINRRG